MGIPLGYVGLPKEHPDHGKFYDDIDVDVHGGLTFSGYWEKEHDGLWYVGFDCGHADDCNPFEYDSNTKHMYETTGIRSNKSLSFVEQECESLAKQLAERLKK